MVQIHPKVPAWCDPVIWHFRIDSDAKAKGFGRKRKPRWLQWQATPLLFTGACMYVYIYIFYIYT